MGSVCWGGLRADVLAQPYDLLGPVKGGDAIVHSPYTGHLLRADPGCPKKIILPVFVLKIIKLLELFNIGPKNLSSAPKTFAHLWSQMVITRSRGAEMCGNLDHQIQNFVLFDLVGRRKLLKMHIAPRNCDLPFQAIVSLKKIARPWSAGRLKWP